MTSGYTPAPLPPHGSIHDWISSAPLRDLVAEYGARPPSEAPAGELLDWLADFSAAHWDFRRIGHVERHQVTAPAFTPARRALIERVATALGFVTAVPPREDAYDHLLVLGGLARTCLQRAEFAGRLITERGLRVPEVTGLGSLRPLGPEETATLPAGAEHEVDALDAAFRAHLDGVRFRALAAPSSEPGVRRANTADTYHFWAERARLGVGDRVLVVTSPIFVPFQHCDALRTLAVPYRCTIETVGLDAARATLPTPPEATGPDRYLQEIRSAILSLRRLFAAL
ncbi:hypothetical protein [Actinoplanes sp. NPDC051851]|uniref:hypothetical protein n=1 Tax=Actinoplanes sp. NPDC051851 TaxID=3154753 RepID=UPI003431DA7F